MTARENMLRAYRHEKPEWVPNGFTDIDIWDSFGERYFGEGSGDDWFGVNWTYTPELHSQTETPGQEVIDDLEKWRERVHFPDLNSITGQRSRHRPPHIGTERTKSLSACF